MSISMKVSSKVAGVQASPPVIFFAYINGPSGVNEDSAPDITISCDKTGSTTLAQLVEVINTTATLIVAEVLEGGDEALSDGCFGGSQELSGGVDSALAGTTTAQLQGIFSTSTLVDAAGGSTGTAAVLTKTNLSGGAG